MLVQSSANKTTNPRKKTITREFILHTLRVAQVILDNVVFPADVEGSALLTLRELCFTKNLVSKGRVLELWSCDLEFALQTTLTTLERGPVLVSPYPVNFRGDNFTP